MKHLLVLQSDFGLSDGAVAAMEGVALSVDHQLRIYNLTHDIPPFDIYEASYRLLQAVPFWPEGSVFVSVVDPGVGSKRRSCTVKTKSGQYIVSPDNGTLGHIARVIGIESIREISKDERRNGKIFSQTFHGRDIYAYVGAQLAAGNKAFEEIGPEYSPDDVVFLEIPEAEFDGTMITGTIETLDVRFGSLWTNITAEQFLKLNVNYGNLIDISVCILLIIVRYNFVTDDTKYFLRLFRMIRFIYLFKLEIFLQKHSNEQIRYSYKLLITLIGIILISTSIMLECENNYYRN